MSVSDEELDEVLSPETHSDEIDTDSLSPGDMIEPELVDDDMLLGDLWSDDDGYEIGVIETDDGHLIKVHRPGDDSALTDTDTDETPNWKVRRFGDFSTVL